MCAGVHMYMCCQDYGYYELPVYGPLDQLFVPENMYTLRLVIRKLPFELGTDVYLDTCNWL